MSETARWNAARELFLELVELSEHERELELERRCTNDPDLARWVKDLLRHDTGAPTPAHERLGPYEIVRSLGRGGMGDVCVARRVDGAYEREVAIKRLHKGVQSDEIVRRFLRERQTLARLDHAYIVRLLDGGTTDAGEPYLVMELVDGEPADAFAARLDSLQQKLELFLRITEAVAHAHARGFVHRDLKPQNILVRADGAPRLLDFGIARVESADAPHTGAGDAPLTRAGHRMFTPEYASPEQIRGETATAQSDVFALGVLLYVFVAGVHPFAASKGLRELEASICDDDTPPPSSARGRTTNARIPRDLDAIVLCCLAKRPADRYATVDALRDDVRAFLDGRPIRARRTSIFARALRRARRRPVHAIALLLLVSALAAGAVTWRVQHEDARRRTELRVAVSDRIETAEALATRGELDRAEQEIEAAVSALRELPGEHVLEAEARSRQAIFASARRDYDAALAFIDRGFELLGDARATEPLLTARLLNARTFALQMRSPGPASLEAARAAREHTLAHIAEGHVLRVDAITGWATELGRAGRSDEALSALEAALADARLIDDPKREVVARASSDLAGALAARGRFAEASARRREALEILTWIHGESHPAVAVVRYNLGTVLFRDGQIEDAVQQFQRSLTSARTAQHDVLIGANQHFLASVHLADRRFGPAETAAREAVAVRERIGPAGALAESQCILGLVLDASARKDEARALFASVFAKDVSLPETLEAEARHRLGALLSEAGDDTTARAHFERALELKRKVLGPTHPDCGELQRRLER